MSAAAVIDLESFRQRRANAVRPAPVAPAAAVTWQPMWVWFWMPVR